MKTYFLSSGFCSMTWSWRWSILPAMRISYTSTWARWFHDDDDDGHRHHDYHHQWPGRQMVGGSHHCCSLFAWTSRWHNLFYVIISWHHSSWLCLSSVGITITSLPSSSLTSTLLLGYSITLCSNWSQCWSNNKTLKILHFFVTQIAS